MTTEYNTQHTNGAQSADQSAAQSTSLVDTMLGQHHSLADVLRAYNAHMAEEALERSREEQAKREREARAAREEIQARQSRLARLLREGLGDTLYGLLVDQAELTLHEQPDWLAYRGEQALPRASLTLRAHSEATDKTAHIAFTLLPMNAPRDGQGELTLSLIREEGDWRGQRQYSTIITTTPVSQFREQLPRALAEQWQRLQDYVDGKLKRPDSDATADAATSEPGVRAGAAEALSAYLADLAQLERAALTRTSALFAWAGIGEDTPRHEVRDVTTNTRLIEMRAPAKRVASAGHASSLTVELRKDGSVRFCRVEAPKNDRRAKVREQTLSVEEMALVVEEWDNWRASRRALIERPLVQAAEALAQSEQAWLAASGRGADHARDAETLQREATRRAASLRSAVSGDDYLPFLSALREAVSEAVGEMRECLVDAGLEPISAAEFTFAIGAQNSDTLERIAERAIEIDGAR